MPKPVRKKVKPVKGKTFKPAPTKGKLTKSKGKEVPAKVLPKKVEVPWIVEVAAHIADVCGVPEGRVPDVVDDNVKFRRLFKVKSTDFDKATLAKAAAYNRQYSRELIERVSKL